MEHHKIGNDLVVNWRFLYSDGTPFPLTGYTYDLLYYTGRGTSTARDTAVIGEDANLLSWTFKADDQHFAGSYDLCLRLFLNGTHVAEFRKQNAFALKAATANDNGPGFVTIESICDAASLPDALLRVGKATDRAVAAAVVGEELNEIFIAREPETVTAKDPDESISYIPTDDDTEYPDITI